MTTVLFVDDDPNMLAAARRTLRKEAYEILTAESAAEAVKLLLRVQVDVVVSDQGMSGMRGEELLEFVRVHYPATMRIMLTGGVDLGTSMRVIHAGELYRYLCKPVEPAELVRAVRGAVERRKVLEESDRLHRQAT
jgi:DNA-binding NtrC family response regulator